jgi:hypothetical protein
MLLTGGAGLVNRTGPSAALELAPPGDPGRPPPSVNVVPFVSGILPAPVTGVPNPTSLAFVTRLPLLRLVASLPESVFFFFESLGLADSSPGG